MGFPERLLADDEHLVLYMRTHVKALIVPILVLLVAAAAAIYLIWIAPWEGGVSTVVTWVVAVLAVLAVLRWSVWPIMRWLSTTYTVTSERLMTRTGVVNRVGRDIPLGRVNDVTYEQGPVDRLFGCGTLIVASASEHGQIVLHDVPQVHAVQLRMSELVRDVQGWSARGTRSGRTDETEPIGEAGASPESAPARKPDATGRPDRPDRPDSPE